MKGFIGLILTFLIFASIRFPVKNAGLHKLEDLKLINERGNATQKKLIFVQGGVLVMGSPSGDEDEKPMHVVFLKSFYIGRYEITNAQYAKFLNYYKSDKVKSGRFSGKKMIYEHELGIVKNGNKWFSQPGYEKHPVVNITWYGANEFCQYLGCRLPTEAEWEYAARGGKNTKKYRYSGSNKPYEVAWYYQNSGKKTHPIAKKRPNELNIYDLSGNVWEWCSDIYDKDYYKKSPKYYPKGPKQGLYRVARGGSYISSLSNLRNTDRVRALPDDKSSAFGFRIVKSIE